MPNSKSSIEERFWSKVRKTDSCWEWTGKKCALGYGRMKSGKRTLQVHRVSFQIAFGEIPRGLFVCHSCDNPSCVNPAHLWLGTNDDNMNDMARKHRAANGERSPKTTITEAQVREIIALHKTGQYRHWQLASQFHVSRSTISRLVNRKTWIHLDS